MSVAVEVLGCCEEAVCLATAVGVALSIGRGHDVLVRFSSKAVAHDSGQHIVVMFIIVFVVFVFIVDSVVVALPPSCVVLHLYTPLL